MVGIPPGHAASIGQRKIHQPSRPAASGGHAALHPRPPGFHGDPGGGTTATGTSAEGRGERQRRWGRGIFPKNWRFHEDFMRILCFSLMFLVVICGIDRALNGILGILLGYDGNRMGRI